MNQQGFFKLLIIVVVGVLLLAYFKVDLRELIDHLLALYGKIRGN